MDEGWKTVLLGLPWPNHEGEEVERRGNKLRRTEVVRLESILGEIRDVLGEKMGGVDSRRERVDVGTGEVVRDYEGVEPERMIEEEEEEEGTPELEVGEGSVTTTTEADGMDLDTIVDEGEDSDDDEEFDEVLPVPRLSIPATTSFEISFADPLPVEQVREETPQNALDPDEEYGSDRGETELDKLFSRTLLILQDY